MPFITGTPVTGGGGPTPDLAAVLAQGFDAGGFAITNPAPLYTPPALGLEQLDSGAGALIGDGANALLPWSHVTGDALVDLTNPLRPKVLTDGFYAIQVSVGGGAMTAGGLFTVELQADTAGITTAMTTDSRPASVTQPSPIAFVSNTRYMVAGRQFYCRVTNHDGAAARTFGFAAASVSRIG